MLSMHRSRVLALSPVTHLALAACGVRAATDIATLRKRARKLVRWSASIESAPVVPFRFPGYLYTGGGPINPFPSRVT